LTYFFELRLAFLKCGGAGGALTGGQFVQFGQELLVEFVLLQSTFVRSLRFGADERLRRALPLGEMGAVELVLVDLLMEMLPAVLANRKSPDTLRRIA